MNEYLTRKYIALQIARSDEGAAGVEYGIMVAAVSVVIVAAALAIGLKIVPGFDAVNNGL